jgi:hypothetical protein
MRIEVVPLELVHSIWPDVEKFIDDSLEWAGGDYTKDQVRAKLATGQWILLVAATDKVHGAMVVNVYNELNFRVLYVLATGGKFIISNDTYGQLCRIATNFGATRIRAAVRDSMERLLRPQGFKELYKIVEAQI